MSLPNALVTLRAALSLLIAVIVVATPHAGAAYAVALVLFLVGVATDVADGAIARRGQATALGATLDPLADKALVLAVLLPLGLRVPSIGAFVALLVARDVAVTWLRLWLAPQGIAVGASPLAKLKTALLFASGALYLLAMATFGGIFLAAAQGCLVAGTLAALLSGAQYLLAARRMRAAR